MYEDVPQITNFKELMNELGYSWNYPQHDIVKHSDGTYSLDKLYIEPDRVSYKTDNWVLAEGVFEEFESFYNFLEMLERKNEDDISII